MLNCEVLFLVLQQLSSVCAAHRGWHKVPQRVIDPCLEKLIALPSSTRPFICQCSPGVWKALFFFLMDAEKLLDWGKVIYGQFFVYVTNFIF